MFKKRDQQLLAKTYEIIIEAARKVEEFGSRNDEFGGVTMSGLAPLMARDSYDRFRDIHFQGGGDGIKSVIPLSQVRYKVLDMIDTELDKFGGEELLMSGKWNVYLRKSDASVQSVSHPQYPGDRRKEDNRRNTTTFILSEAIFVSAASDEWQPRYKFFEEEPPKDETPCYILRVLSVPVAPYSRDIIVEMKEVEFKYVRKIKEDKSEYFKLNNDSPLMRSDVIFNKRTNADYE